MLKENKALRSANVARRVEADELRQALTAKDSTLAATERRVYFEQVLRKDADSNAAVWKAKARKRNWIVVVLSALLAGITYTAVAR